MLDQKIEDVSNTKKINAQIMHMQINRDIMFANANYRLKTKMQQFVNDMYEKKTGS